MMALALVILVAVDTAISGFMLARVRELGRRVGELDDAIEAVTRVQDDLARSVDA